MVGELVSAHKRGVQVKVILDQNINFAAWEERGGRWQREGKNDSLFAYLKKAGIETYYDNLYTVSHGKMIIIDEEIVIVGSVNWTESALNRNWEASSLIRSKDLAKEYLEDLARITIDHEASILDEERAPPVRLSETFLTDPSFAPRMIEASDRTAFDIYILLLKNFDGNAEGRVDIDYKSMRSAIGMDEKLSYASARNTLREALIRLDDRYRLIKRIRRPSKSPYALLLDYEKEVPYTLPRGKYCSIPDEYWSYGWNKQLSLPEKYCLLINIIKAGTARSYIWTGYREGLMNEFKVSKDTISKGMKGLRRLNIIDIEYPQYPEDGGFEGRAPVRYRLLGLYSPKILEEEKEKLKKHYGESLFETAEKYAEMVFKENDIQVIGDIIKKIDLYGAEHVDHTFNKVSQWAPDNPKRSYKYVVGILKTEAKQSPGASHQLPEKE
ncbi:MAG: phospholipase D-like domain-containing protein [Candidatus Omnitrophota bacterium]